MLQRKSFLPSTPGGKGKPNIEPFQRLVVPAIRVSSGAMACALANTSAPVGPDGALAPVCEVVLVFSNDPAAPGLDIARAHGVEGYQAGPVLRMLAEAYNG